MDSPVTSNAKALLSVSESFESCLPDSPPKILENLDELTVLNLKVKKLLLDALVQSKVVPKRPGDQALADALLKLRGSKSSFRKSSGIFQTVIR